MIFRYPGGKTRMLPALRPYLDRLAECDNSDTYIEPFVGGGSTLIDFAKRHRGHRLIANDLDPWMAAFWRLVASDQKPDKLYALLETKPTVSLFCQLRETQPTDDVGKAYRAVFFNRTTFSGILRSGPIGGYGQKSAWAIDCRYNAGRLVREIRELRELMNGRLEAHEKDALRFLGLFPERAAYLDPPYFVKGGQLYREAFPEAQHRQLRDVLGTRRGSWVLSYDNVPPIREMYGVDFTTTATEDVRYSIRDRKETWHNDTELIIASIQPRLLESQLRYELA